MNELFSPAGLIVQAYQKCACVEQAYCRPIWRFYEQRNSTSLSDKVKTDINFTPTLHYPKLLPYLDWAFSNLKRLGGGAKCPSPPSNLGISSQMMMKLRKVILWVEIVTN